MIDMFWSYDVRVGGDGVGFAPGLKLPRAREEVKT
jgi:hypothetical protein